MVRPIRAAFLTPQNVVGVAALNLVRRLRLFCRFGESRFRDTRREASEVAALIPNGEHQPEHGGKDGRSDQLGPQRPLRRRQNRLDDLHERVAGHGKHTELSERIQWNAR